jgi:predicted oxidoreductase (fatty acid repression mutant protein)
MSDSENDLIENIMNLLKEVQEEQKNIKNEIKKVKNDVINKLNAQKSNFIKLLEDFEEKTFEDINQSIKIMEEKIIEEIKENPLLKSNFKTPY